MEAVGNRAQVRWTRATVAFAVGLGAIAVLGLLMVTGTVRFGLSPSQAESLGAGLVGGAVVGLAVLGAEFAFFWQLHQLDADRQAHAARESLRLQLGLGTDFRFIDLAGQDLSRFYLPRRNLHGADLRAACLDRADLTEADLTMAELAGASLVGAGLAHAKLRDADLSGSNLTLANLTGTDLTGADMRRASIYDALFNNDTIWPDGVEAVGRSCFLGTGCVLSRLSVEHLHHE